jgi:hypothetical protein
MDTMTRLETALQALGLVGEVALGGRWVKVQGERCAVYVIESVGQGYYMWCDHPEARLVQSYSDPTEAIQTGLRRAERR